MMGFKVVESRTPVFPMVLLWLSDYESQVSSMAKLLIANEVRIGGLGGGG